MSDSIKTKQYLAAGLLTRFKNFVIFLIDNNFQLEAVLIYTKKKIADILRGRGFKITPQRRAILSAITHSHEHLTPSAIYEKVHHKHPGIGLVTIYRTLEILNELGLVCEMHAVGNCRSYLMRRPSGHHHHLICSECGRVIDFTNCDLGELERRLSKESGFKINGHLLEFLGQCRDCYEKMVA